MTLKSRIDPELLAGYELFESLHLLDDIQPDTIVETRERLRALYIQLRKDLPKVDGVSFEDRMLPRGIRVRVYRKDGAPAPGPAVIWVHGGGMILGTIDTDDAVCSNYAARLGAVVVSVDYRLAPEFPHPVPVEDCHSALAWTVANAAALGVDPARVAIAGSSAGAGLAAATALYARDHGGPRLAFQCLVYPMLDDRNDTASARELAAIASWSGRSNQTGWNALLAGQAGTPDVSIYAAPARATDLAGLPPTLIQVGELDLFRDEDIAYATRLLRAGVPTELHVYPGAIHASDTLAPTSRVGSRMIKERIAALAAALGVGP